MNTRAKLRLRRTRYERPIGPASPKDALRVATHVVQSELRSCDKLAERARIAFEKPRLRDTSPSEPSWLCPHNKPRHEVCSACGRDEVLASEYKATLVRALLNLRSKGAI